MPPISTAIDRFYLFNRNATRATEKPVGGITKMRSSNRRGVTAQNHYSAKL
jgi:hypothetical protein